MALHNSLTGADLHENKGVATAVTGTVATASSGATVWQKVGAASIDNSTVKNLNTLAVSGTLSDLSTAQTAYMALPLNCNVVTLSCVLTAAITGSSTSVLSAYNGATLMGSLTITAPQSAGQCYALSFGSNNSFAAPAALKVTSGGGTTGTCPLALTAVCTLT